jgi:hypothetical protein
MREGMRSGGGRDRGGMSRVLSNSLMKLMAPCCVFASWIGRLRTLEWLSRRAQGVGQYVLGEEHQRGIWPLTGFQHAQFFIAHSFVGKTTEPVHDQDSPGLQSTRRWIAPWGLIVFSIAKIRNDSI